jgi:hypothetical protein
MKSVLIPVQCVETDDENKALVLKQELIESPEAPGLDFQPEREVSWEVSSSITPQSRFNACTQIVRRAENGDAIGTEVQRPLRG